MPYLITVLIALAILLIIIVTRPPTFTVRRSLRIAAPASRIHPQVVDFRAWTGWSPWEGLDPQTVRTYSAHAVGVGATYHWSGSSKVGEGRMIITEDRPDQHIAIDIEFFRPFSARNRITFDFVPDGAATQVTWTMSGRNSFMGKAMSLVFNCDKMIGGMFEQGLGKLKVVGEAG
jgi:hypothetical protein